MTVPSRFLCYFCKTIVDRDAPDVYKQIVAWVHGPKSDGSILREYTAQHAHPACIKKAQEGQPPNQIDLFESAD